MHRRKIIILKLIIDPLNVIDQKNKLEIKISNSNNLNIENNLNNLYYYS